MRPPAALQRCRSQQVYPNGASGLRKRGVRTESLLCALGALLPSLPRDLCLGCSPCTYATVPLGAVEGEWDVGDRLMAS